MVVHLLLLKGLSSLLLCSWSCSEYQISWVLTFQATRPINIRAFLDSWSKTHSREAIASSHRNKIIFLITYDQWLKQLHIATQSSKNYSYFLSYGEGKRHMNHVVVFRKKKLSLKTLLVPSTSKFFISYNCFNLMTIVSPPGFLSVYGISG